MDLCTPIPGPEIEEISDVGTTSWLREPISVCAMSAVSSRCRMLSSAEGSAYRCEDTPVLWGEVADILDVQLHVGGVSGAEEYVVVPNSTRCRSRAGH